MTVNKTLLLVLVVIAVIVGWQFFGENALAALLGLFIPTGKKAGKSEVEVQKYKEDAELDKLLAVEEIARHKEEVRAGQDIADAIEPLKEDTTKPNKRFRFK